MPADDDDLIPDARLAELNAQLDRVAATLVDTRRSNERRARAMAWGLIAATAVGGLGLVEGWQARDAFEDFEASRDAARITSCEDDNAARAADRQSALALVTPEALADAADDPATVARALDFLGAIRPLRDCSLEAIEAYFTSGGTEGLQPLDLPPHVAEFLERHRP